MRYLIAAHTDVGIKKKTNQDSYMIKEAQTKMGRIFFGVLCDGMGGLSNGELASATVIRAMEQWFETDFPQLLVHTTDAEEVLEKVKNDWHVIANELNVQLARYVEGTGNRMGTTIVTLLLIKNQYFIMNVGDSRAYALSNQVYQLTKDQIEAEESDGFVSFTFTSPISEGGTLLMDSLVLGLTEIEHSYSKRYLKVKVREV